MKFLQHSFPLHTSLLTFARTLSPSLTSPEFTCYITFCFSSTARTHTPKNPPYKSHKSSPEHHNLHLLAQILMAYLVDYVSAYLMAYLMAYLSAYLMHYVMDYVTTHALCHILVISSSVQQPAPSVFARISSTEIPSNLRLHQPTPLLPLSSHMPTPDTSRHSQTPPDTPRHLPAPYLSSPCLPSPCLSTQKKNKISDKISKKKIDTLKNKNSQLQV